MSIRIKRVADPGAVLLLDRQFDDEGVEAAFAATQAREIVVHELERYCSGLIEGRSILIAGHRGAGKTSMVKSALLEIRDEQDRLRLRKPPMRPLPSTCRRSASSDSTTPRMPRCARRRRRASRSRRSTTTPRTAR